MYQKSVVVAKVPGSLQYLHIYFSTANTYLLESTCGFLIFLYQIRPLPFLLGPMDGPMEPPKTPPRKNPEDGQPAGFLGFPEQGHGHLA